MTHTGFLGLHIALVIGIGLYFERHYLGNLHTVAFKANTFHGIVGHEAHILDSQCVEYMGTDTVIAFVGLVSEMKIGVDRIKAVLLKLVCRYLIHQTDAAALLVEIYDSSPAFLLDQLHGEMKLLAAFATLRTEYVAGHAGRVDTNQHRFIACDIALDKRDMLQAVLFLTERYESEMSVSGRHIDFLTALHE